MRQASAASRDENVINKWEHLDAALKSLPLPPDFVANPAASQPAVHDLVNAVFLDGTQTAKHAATVLHSAFPEFEGLTLPQMFEQLAAATSRKRESTLAQDQAVLLEYCSGQAAITSGALELGLRCACFDKLYGSRYNCFTRAGMRNWVGAVLHTRAGATAWFAPTCSSFVFLSRSTSGRSQENPWGNPSNAFVHDGNRLLLRVVIVALLCALVDVDWAIEQPISSIMTQLPFVERLFEKLEVSRKTCWLGAYGADSPKLLKIYGFRAEWLKQLANGKPSFSTVSARLATSRVVRGVKKCTGCRGKLRDSSAYPKLFGSTVARLVRDNLFLKGEGIIAG